MADVTLPWAAQRVVVDLDTCVKTGRATRETVTLRGSTTPTWVTFLLVGSVIGFVFASMMTSRRYEITVPFTHASYDHWVARRRVAWLVGLLGAAALLAAATSGHPGLGVSVALALVVGAAALGVVNAVVNGVGVRVTRDHDLVLTGTHPDFAGAVQAAAVEPLPRP